MCTVAPNSPFEHCVSLAKIVGIGGAGISVIEYIAREKLPCVELVTVDSVPLPRSVSPGTTHLLIGRQLTQGQGSGGNREIGRQCAEEAALDLEQVLEGADKVFVVCGMGGGTGTGAAPVVARIAENAGATSIVGVVSKPFTFEGSRRLQNGWIGIDILKVCVDSLAVVNCDDVVMWLNDKGQLSVNDFFSLIARMLAWRVLAQLW